MKYFLVVMLALSCIACSKQCTGHSRTFANGDVASLVTANHLILKNSRGQLLQESTFTTPSFEQATKLLTTFQQDLRMKNTNHFIAHDIRYPLRVNINGKAFYYKNTEALKIAFSKIFTSAIVQAILQQDPFRLFSNDQGVMLASGKIWFNTKGIFTVNR